MRFIQSNISAISNRIANQGIQLIVRVEAAAIPRCHASVHALTYGVPVISCESDAHVTMA